MHIGYMSPQQVRERVDDNQYFDAHRYSVSAARGDGGRNGGRATTVSPNNAFQNKG